MQYKYLFGPVPSRRLGLSLGVDLVPFKTCSFNCIYCECNATTDLTCERKEYAPFSDVCRELSHFLKCDPELDYITFSGSGEPTLHSKIGVIIDFLKESFPKHKVALLTNASLFSDSQLRGELLGLDLVMPSLDAVSEIPFKKINRPADGIESSFIVNGLIDFRKEFKGKLWLEILIVPGINDDDELEKLKVAVHAIKPDKVQINTLDRPGTEDDISSASKDLLEKVLQKLDYPSEIIAHFSGDPAGKKNMTDVNDLIVNMIQRRPMTVEDISFSIGIDKAAAMRCLKGLLVCNKVKTKRLERGIFYIPVSGSVQEL